MDKKNKINDQDVEEVTGGKNTRYYRRLTKQKVKTEDNDDTNGDVNTRVKTRHIHL